MTERKKNDRMEAIKENEKKTNLKRGKTVSKGKGNEKRKQK